MARPRKVRDSGFKARVTLDALKERETVGQLAKRHGVHPTQIHEWKRRRQDQASSLFDRGNAAKKTEDFDAAELYEEIGCLKMELDWVKKEAAQFSERPAALRRARELRPEHRSAV